MNIFQILNEYGPIPTNRTLSDDTLKWLHDWMWSQKALRSKQIAGIPGIPENILEELRIFVPKDPILVYRAFESFDSERKSLSNKLISYTRDSNLALDLAIESNENGGYLHCMEVTPDQILVDTSLIPDARRLDLLDNEVIIINS